MQLPQLELDPLSQPADTSEPKPRHWLSDTLRRHPRLRREVWLLGAGLVVGFVLMPLSVYVVGVLTLGPYSGGGAGSFLADQYSGLFHGWAPGWGVVVGPYLLVQLLRLLIRIRRWVWPRPRASDEIAS